MKTTLACVLLMVTLAAEARFQSPETAVAPAQPSGIEGAERFLVPSARSGTRYQVDVIRVNSGVAPLAEGYTLPVIYLLDGNTLFPMVSQMASTIVTFSSRLPGVLVVAIGYPSDPALARGDDIKRKQTLRTRDLSPPSSADFLAFIEDELKPFVAVRYPVNVGEQTLAGHSMGGLFTLNAFVRRPAAFKRYVALSPSVFWGNHALIKELEAVPPSAAFASMRLFVGVGGLETKEKMGQDMIGDARTVAAVLQRRNFAGLSVGFHVFEDEDHLSVIPGALMRGLRDVHALP